MFWWFWEAFMPQPVWAIESADAGEAAEFADIHQASFARGWSVDEMDVLLRDRAVIACVLRREGDRRAYGFALSRVAKDEAEILSIAVESGGRGKGGGAALFGRHLGRLAAEGVRRVVLEVDEDNEAALALYARFGFIEVGRRKAYYARADGSKGVARVLALDSL